MPCLSVFGGPVTHLPGGVERKTRSHLLLISNSAHIQYPSLLSQTSAVFCNMGGGEMRDPESFPLYLSFPAPTSDPVIVTKYISTRTGPSQPPTWKDFACHCRTIVPPTTSVPPTPHVAWLSRSLQRDIRAASKL